MPPRRLARRLQTPRPQVRVSPAVPTPVPAVTSRSFAFVAEGAPPPEPSTSIGYGSWDPEHHGGLHFGHHTRPGGPPSSSAAAGPPSLVHPSSVFDPPGRNSRPKFLCIAVRGLPGSGKSALCRRVRDWELRGGGRPPRAVCIDDYFNIEEEQEVEDEERRGRKKKILVPKYQYDAEMEPEYRASMVRRRLAPPWIAHELIGRRCRLSLPLLQLKSLKKTLGSRIHPLVVVDADNERADDIKAGTVRHAGCCWCPSSHAAAPLYGLQSIWSSCVAASYELLVLESPCRDPVVCARQSTHGRTQAEIEMVWPPWHLAYRHGYAS